MMPNPPAPPADSGPWQAVGRHNISNIVIEVDGNRARSRAYWFHYSSDNQERDAVFDGFGHHEDELAPAHAHSLGWDAPAVPPR